MRAVALITLLAATGLGGCMPSRKLAAGELDRWWYLQADPWPDAEAQPLTVAGRRVPTRWVFRRDNSLIWSTVSIVRAAQTLKTGADEIEIGISPAHARMMADILARGRRAMLDLKEIADPDDPPSPEQWSAAAADALMAVETVARLASEQAGGGAGAASREGDPLGWSAGPVLQMALAWLNERSGGALLAEMTAGQADALREALVRVVLRIAFAVAGRREPAELPGKLTGLMDRRPPPGELRAALREALLAGLREAPAAPPGGKLRSVISAVVSSAPALLEVLESFVRQWERMESLTVEIRRLGGRAVVAATIRTAAGRSVRLAKLHFAAPAIVFRGGCRIVAVPEVAGTGELAVLFEPVEGGATEVRFEGLVYSLARLVLPLASGALREVRVATASGAGGRRMTSVALLMEARGDRGDPRRVIAFQDVRRNRVVRDAFSTRREALASEQVFNYLTPTRRYTFHRAKGAAKE